MAIYQTGGYRVNASAVDKVKKAIKDFVPHIAEHEPGTEMYLAWQQKDDPTRFLHLFIFADAAAQKRHGQSDAVHSFEAAYGSELVDGDVLFTNYEMVAGKRDAFGNPESGRILKKFYEAVMRRDLAAARAYLADDLVFVGLFDTYRSADAYLKALAGLLQVTVRLEVKGIIGQGNDAAVFFNLETKAPAEGKVLVAEWHQLKDGKIANVRSAFDGRPYAAMFSGSGHS
ncbi:MAG TPA: nuclear transport factor 2 family protein [Stellaceae bacterium]|nr:nuclear transport factor 2 family protein [Stellaceae bacterium]